MRRQMIVLFGVLVALLAGLAVASLAGSQRSQKRQKTAKVDMQAPVEASPKGALVGLTPPVMFLPDPPRPVPFLDVLPSRDAKGETLKLHRQLAEQMTAAKLITDHRLKHFQWLNAPQYRVMAWGGFIRAIAP